MEEGTGPCPDGLQQSPGRSRFDRASRCHRAAGWQFQLEGQKLKGILLLHVILAVTSTVMIWLVWAIHFRARRIDAPLPVYRLPMEFLAVGVITLTGHLGGFLSGVNGPG
jgi:hypothetical protein